MGLELLGAPILALFSLAIVFILISSHATVYWRVCLGLIGEDIDF